MIHARFNVTYQMKWIQASIMSRVITNDCNITVYMKKIEFN